METIYGYEQLNRKIVENKDKIIILYFGAKWCGPCQKLKMKILSNHETDLLNSVILYIDCDDENNEDIYDDWGAKSLPTQIFVKLDNNNVKMINKLEGYDWIKLKLIYDELNNENKN